jgi:hypothetical protein
MVINQFQSSIATYHHSWRGKTRENNEQMEAEIIPTRLKSRQLLIANPVYHFNG